MLFASLKFNESCHLFKDYPSTNVRMAWTEINGHDRWWQCMKVKCNQNSDGLCLWLPLVQVPVSFILASKINVKLLKRTYYTFASDGNPLEHLSASMVLDSAAEVMMLTILLPSTAKTLVY